MKQTADKNQLPGGNTSGSDDGQHPDFDVESLIPVFTEEERQNLITYYELNKRHSEEYREEAMVEFRKHPVWGPIIGSMTKEMMEAQNQHSQELQEAAIYDGEWIPYLRNLLNQGVLYSKMGVNFRDWIEVVLLARKYFILMLERDYKHDAELILKCTQGMNLMIDVALCGIGESYITEERKKAEQKRQEYTSLLEVKNTQLVDFCNIVSHNLRAPLANIMMLVDYIESNENTEERMEVFGKIKPVIDHLSEVFNELVESVQVRQDTGVKSDKIDLEAAFDKVALTFDTEILAYDAKITRDFSAAPHIYFPAKYVDSILMNLLSNSLKYKSPDRVPEIIFKSWPEGESVFLSVSDNGLGIDLVMHKDNLFKIRKVFHKHPDAKGFGLFMVKTQVDAMGGKIWAESTPDVGSTFFIEFKNQKS